MTGAGGPKSTKSRWYVEPPPSPPREADVHIEGMKALGVWRRGRPIVAGTDAVEKATDVRSLQGRHPGRGRGRALSVDARVPNYADKSGAVA